MLGNPGFVANSSPCASISTRFHPNFWIRFKALPRLDISRSMRAGSIWSRSIWDSSERPTRVVDRVSETVLSPSHRKSANSSASQSASAILEMGNAARWGVVGVSPRAEEGRNEAFCSGKRCPPSTMNPPVSNGCNPDPGSTTAANDACEFLYIQTEFIQHIHGLGNTEGELGARTRNHNAWEFRFPVLI